MTPTPEQSPQAEPPTLKPCPACEAPLSAREMRERMQGSICVGCTVTPPTPATSGGVLFCSRSGKMLAPEDFLEGRAIRVGKRCFHLDSVRDARRRGLQSGTFACDCCGADIPARRLVRGKAKVVDKVVLCHKCYARDPDPAGNQRDPQRGASPEDNAEVDAPPQEHAAQTLPALPAATDAPDKREQAGAESEPTDYAVAPAASATAPQHGDADANADSHGDAVSHSHAASDSNADSDSEGDFAQLQTDPMGLEAQATVKSDEPIKDGPFAEPSKSAPSDKRTSKKRSSGRLASARRATGVVGKVSPRRLQIPSATRRPHLSPARRSATGTPASPRARHTASAAPTEEASAAAAPVTHPGHGVHASSHGSYLIVGSRETTAMLGVMVLLVLVLCGMLLAVFLSTQSDAPHAESTEAEATALLAVNERLDRLVQQYGSVNQRLDDLERRFGAGEAPPPQPGLDPFDERGANHGQWPQGFDESHDPRITNPEANHSDGHADEQGPQVPEEPAPANEPSEPDDGPVENPRIVALASSDPSTRLEAVLDVHRYALYEAVPQLIERVRDDGDDYVRAFAIKTLASFRATEARDVVEQAAATAEHPVVQSAAADALPKLARE